MIDKKLGVLILSPFFSPNIGGVESHLDDLVSALDKRKYKVFVQTYSPITTSNVVWESREKKEVAWRSLDMDGSAKTCSIKNGIYN